MASKLASLKRNYYVGVLGGGRRYFSYLESALRFARTQAQCSWSQEDWTVWDTETGRAVYGVRTSGEVYDPFDGGGTQYRQPLTLPEGFVFVRPYLRAKV